MSDKLQHGHKLKTKLLGDNEYITVEHHLGEGGQGDVYQIDYNGEKKALKWYKKSSLGKGISQKDFYDLIAGNVGEAPGKAFLWPTDITEEYDGVFGYVMDLRPEGYHVISDFMLRRVSFDSFRTTVKAMLSIVEAFRLLHGRGLCYQDLNDGNFFIHPENGDVLICDNDNAAPENVDTGILGKPRYMAPEIARGKPKIPDPTNPNLGKPNTYSDQFSLAVILFILLCGNHPLEGKRSLAPCLTPALQEKLYGTEPWFIMDPANTENKPDPFMHKNVLNIWGYLPDYMQEIFLKAFGQEALHKPNRRPTELDWVKVLVRFRSEIVPCSCGKNEMFAVDGIVGKCTACNTVYPQPLVLEFPNYRLPVVHNVELNLCQVSYTNKETALNLVGKVLKKKDSGALGLQNRSDLIWTAVTPSGKTKKLQKTEVMPINEGIELTIEKTVIKFVKV